MRRKKGYAFVLVLCIGVVMCALLTGVMTLSLSAKKSTKTLEDNYKLSSMSESGVEKGLACLKNKIQNTPEIFSNVNTSLACDTFSFQDNNISCKVIIEDTTEDTDPAVSIDSKATNTISNKSKEDIAYIKKKDISNVYYSMLFSNVFTTLDDVYKSDTTPNTDTSFDIGNSVHDITLDGNMYLQGGKINFKPTTSPEYNENDSYAEYYNNHYHISPLYYLYATDDFENYPYPDPYAKTYTSGQVKVNCNEFDYPSDTGDATKAIFNKTVTSANTIVSHPDTIGSLSPNSYPILHIMGVQPGEGLTNYNNYLQGINMYRMTTLSGMSYTKQTTLINNIKRDMNNYDMYYIPQGSGKLVVFLVTPKAGVVSPPPFDWASFMLSVKDYIFNNVDLIKNESDPDKKQDKYKQIYKAYVIDGNVIVPKDDSVSAYINHIIYCTGECDLYSSSGNTSFILENSGIMAKKIKVYNVVNTRAYVDDYPSYDYKIGKNVYYYDQLFARAISLHGIKGIGEGTDIDGLSPFDQPNKNYINSFLIKHLENYANYFTFKIDKWVEK